MSTSTTPAIEDDDTAAETARRVTFEYPATDTSPAGTAGTAGIASSPQQTPALDRQPEPILTDSTDPTNTTNTTNTHSAANGNNARRRANRQVTVTDDLHGDSINGGPPSRRQTSESTRSSRRSQTDPNAGVLRRMTTGLFTPEKKIGKAPTWLGSFRAAICSTWL
jgi:Ca2+:H+ antiporter